MANRNKKSEKEKNLSKKKKSPKKSEKVFMNGPHIEKYEGKLAAVEIIKRQIADEESKLSVISLTGSVSEQQTKELLIDALKDELKTLENDIVYNLQPKAEKELKKEEKETKEEKELYEKAYYPSIIQRSAKVLQEGKLFWNLKNREEQEKILKEKGENISQSLEEEMRKAKSMGLDFGKQDEIYRMNEFLKKKILDPSSDSKKLGEIKSDMEHLEALLQKQKSRYTQERKGEYSRNIDREVRESLLGKKNHRKTTKEKLQKFEDDNGNPLSRFDTGSLQILLEKQQQALESKIENRNEIQSQVADYQFNIESMPPDVEIQLRDSEKDVIECLADIKNTKHDILLTQGIQDYVSKNPEDVLNREKISKIGEEYEKETGFLSTVKKPLTSVKDFVTKNHQGLLDRGKWKNSTSILIGIFMLFLLVLGGMFARSASTLGGSKPKWTFSKREIENSKVKNHKNLSKQSVIVFFVFALFLIVLLFINFRKTESKYVDGRGPRDTSGVGNFFKGISKYHEGAWLTISIVFLIGAIACLFVTFSDKDVYEDSYWIYSFVFFSSIFIFLVFWSIGRSQDSPFLNELYHHDGLKNLNSQIQKWENNRRDDYLKKNVIDSMNKLKVRAKSVVSDYGDIVKNYKNILSKKESEINRIKPLLPRPQVAPITNPSSNPNPPVVPNAPPLPS